MSSNRFDENSDLSTTYIGREDKENKNKLRAEESFPISEHGYTSWLAPNVNFYWTWVQVSPSCQNHSTCNASHATLCQNFPQGLKGYK